MSSSETIKKAVLVIAPSRFRDEEYAEPKKVLQDAGIEVTTASSSSGPCVGRFGLSAIAELSLEDALDGDWDIVAFIGGGGAEVFFDDEDALELARRAVGQGKVVGAICVAPTILSNAGVLSGLPATSFPSEQMALISNGVKWTGNRVTVAPVVGTGATIVTACGPEAATEFGQELVDALKS
ncbi:MAG: DJ-1 family protein [Actinobacteria bacterium]|nr:DJ-1 family protein [Actinomycetota bacterium]